VRFTCDRLNVNAELLGNESAEIVDGKPTRFRTIQVWPKDLPGALRQAERTIGSVGC